MNILFVFEGVIIPERGGIRRVTQMLADYFESHGHQSYYLALEQAGRPPNGRQHFLPVPSPCLAPANVAYCRDLFVRCKIDLVINQCGLGGAMNCLAYLAREAGIPLISCIHSTLLGAIRNLRYAKYDRFRRFGLHWLLPMLGRAPVKQALVWAYKLKYRGHFRQLIRKSDRVVLLSEGIKSELTEYLGYCPSHVLALPNPVEEARAASPGASKLKRILWVGRVVYSKRLDLFLQIWRELESQYPGWSVVVVGDGPWLPMARHYVSKHGLERITFAGMVEAVPYYTDAAMLAFTSAYEGFGLVLAEAMAAGCVPVAFDSFFAAQEIVDAGVNGLLVRPFDCGAYTKALSRLMSDPDSREQMATAAMVKAQKFSLDRIGARWLALFVELLPAANRQPTLRQGVQVPGGATG